MLLGGKLVRVCGSYIGSEKLKDLCVRIFLNLIL